MPNLKFNLGELTNSDISENGYHSKVSGFDDYLNKTNELHQNSLLKLKLVEKIAQI